MQMVTGFSSMKTSMRVATAQFPVSGNAARNFKYIRQQMIQAVAQNAHIVLFPETALPGYGPKHMNALEDYDWLTLQSYTEHICELAQHYSLWVVLGSMRREIDELPLNCLHVISNTGALVDTYGKRMLYDKEKAIYSPGFSPLIVDIYGHRCGFLICYDNCFPELYEEYRDEGVGLIFHAFHNAGNDHATDIAKLMRANLRVRAADNQMSIAASNSSSRYSALAACVVRPDGYIVATKRHRASIAIDTFPAPDLGWTYDNRSIVIL